MSLLQIFLYILGGLIGLTILGSLIGTWIGRTHKYYPTLGGDDE